MMQIGCMKVLVVMMRVLFPLTPIFVLSPALKDSNCGLATERFAGNAQWPLAVDLAAWAVEEE